MQTILGAANYAAIRTSLGLVIGTNVLAYSANLAALDVASTAFGRANLNLADAAALRTAAALGTMATQAASAVAITGGAFNGTVGATTPSTIAATSGDFSSTVTLANNVGFRGKDTGGTAKRLLVLANDNTVYMGAVDAPTTGGSVSILAAGVQGILIDGATRAVTLSAGLSATTGTFSDTVSAIAPSSAISLNLRGRSSDSKGYIRFQNNAASATFAWLGATAADTLVMANAAGSAMATFAAGALTITAGLTATTGAFASAASANGILNVFAGAGATTDLVFGVYRDSPLSATTRALGVQRGGLVQMLGGGASNGATTFPLQIRNAGTGANTGVGISFAPSSDGVISSRDAQILAINNGSNQTSFEFRTSNAAIPALAFRIGSAGEWGSGPADGVAWNAGTNSFVYNGSGSAFIATASNPAFFLNRSGSDGTVIGFYKAAVQVGRIEINGSSTAYVTSSDYRLKTNVEETDRAEALALIRSVPLRDFDWISTGVRERGGLAHELALVKPSAVFGEKDAVDDDDNILAQGVDWSKFVPDLIGGMQALAARVETLELAA